MKLQPQTDLALFLPLRSRALALRHNPAPPPPLLSKGPRSHRHPSRHLPPHHRRPTRSPPRTPSRAVRGLGMQEAPPSTSTSLWLLRSSTRTALLLLLRGRCLWAHPWRRKPSSHSRRSPSRSHSRSAPPPTRRCWCDNRCPARSTSSRDSTRPCTTTTPGRTLRHRRRATHRRRPCCQRRRRSRPRRALCPARTTTRGASPSARGLVLLLWDSKAPSVQASPRTRGLGLAPSTFRPHPHPRLRLHLRPHPHLQSWLRMHLRRRLYLYQRWLRVRPCCRQSITSIEQALRLAPSRSTRQSQVPIRSS